LFDILRFKDAAAQMRSTPTGFLLDPDSLLLNRKFLNVIPPVSFLEKGLAVFAEKQR
jgi:hypothetical protein